MVGFFQQVTGNWSVVSIVIASLLYIYAPVNIVAWVFESRTMRYRFPASKAFFPGLLGIALFYTGALLGIRELPADGWWQSPWLLIGGGVAAIGFFIFRRFFTDAPNYKNLPGATANSPTKWLFDIQQYVIDIFVIVTLGVPVLVASGWLWRIVIVVGLLIFFGSAMLDSGEKQAVIDRARVSHPDDWRPLWREK